MNLMTVSRDLRAQKELEADMRQMNESLERRVAERTTAVRTEISERERADDRAKNLQQELLNASRLSVAGQMAGALAHEISQPLTALTNSVNAARRMPAKGANGGFDIARDILDEAAELALRTGRIIHRQREFVTRGETELRIENLPSLIRDASDLALAGSAASNPRLGFIAAVELAIKRDRGPRQSTQIAKAVARVAELSPREREVLDALVSGHRKKVIAYDLGIVVRTVEIHRARMMDRLAVR
jgi:C4-dicarboxylate-specific signal transduction histidine kinase/DNA-binding CsgD family transcriptional regulator